MGLDGSRRVLSMQDKHLHIEVTSRCTLECPACPRTSWKEITKIPMPKQDLDIADFKSFMDCEGGKKIEILRLCGDYGDCIYYPQLIEFLKEFRDKKFILHTNGSYKSQQFWEEISEILTPDDQIIFGIDGLEHNNHLYRRNSDWNSTMLAVDTIAKKSLAVLKWQTIIFSFNENMLDEIKSYAENKGAIWFSQPSHRFGDDTLVPQNQSNIETEYLYEQEYSTDKIIEIDPKCYSEKTITSDGYLFPCDWIRNPKTLYSSKLWKDRSHWLNRLKISETTFDQAKLVVQEWSDSVQAESLNGSAEVLCKMKCRKGICR